MIWDRRVTKNVIPGRLYCFSGLGCTWCLSEVAAIIKLCPGLNTIKTTRAMFFNYWLRTPPSSWLLHCEGSGKLDRARSRLYRGQILQENMRLKALAEIYTMHSFAQLCNLIFLSKFAKIFTKFGKIRQNF